MRLTTDELEEAKRQLARMQGRLGAAQRLSDPSLSPADKLLLKKYPKHTLEQAREIDATLPSVPKNHPGQDLGYTSGFEKIIAQERGHFHLSGDHT